MVSVLMFFRHIFQFSSKAAVQFPSSSLTAVFAYLWLQFTKKRNDTCEKTHKNLLYERGKGRYRNASLTVEASLAFPAFFFAVLYLLWLFFVLQAEVSIAEAGITAAREAAAYTYVAERLADGENAVAETVLELFDRSIVRDTTATALFYARCEKELLKRARVAQDLGGVWVDTEKDGQKIRIETSYRVRAVNMLRTEKERFYGMRFVYRSWTGEGGTTVGNSEQEGGEKGADTVYMTAHGTVYHSDRACSYIKREIEAVAAGKIGAKRNDSGAKYYACEFCLPVLTNGTEVYVTRYGTKYHALSSCSAMKRSVKEVSWEEAQKEYRACSRCVKKEGEDE